MEEELSRFAHPVMYPDARYLAEYCASSKMEVPEEVKILMGDFRLPEPGSDRPYLYACMVESMDGKIGFADSPEGTLIAKKNMEDPKGGAIDFAVLNVCRCYADAVFIGTGTLKARMNQLWYASIKVPELAKVREKLEKPAKLPLTIIVSRDGTDIPYGHPVFGMEEAPVVMTSEQGAELMVAHFPDRTEIIREPEELTLPSSRIRVLAAGTEDSDMEKQLKLLLECGIRYVCVESPGYTWQLIRKKYLDEYLLDFSGLMAGGGNTTGRPFPFTSEVHPHTRLLSVGYTEGFLFTRQKLLYDI